MRHTAAGPRPRFFCTRMQHKRTYWLRGKTRGIDAMVLQVANGDYNHRIVKNTNFQTKRVPTISICKVFLSFPRWFGTISTKMTNASPKMKESYCMGGSDLDYDIVPCRNFFIYACPYPHYILYLISIKQQLILPAIMPIHLSLQ